MTFKIAFLPGDGVGPEVAWAARRVMESTAEKFGLDLSFQDCAFGGVAIDKFGDPFPDGTRRICSEADAVFLGAVGGPKWDQGDIRPEAGLLGLRQALGVYANLRPTQVVRSMAHFSPLAPDRVKNVDMLIIRELTGGIYFGDKQEGTDVASDLCAYSREEVVRIARVAFEAARKRRGKVTSVDKANVLATSRLWRHVVAELHQEEFRDLELEHVLVDAMAMKLIQVPSAFDVILTENMFGDILSDEASVIGGSIGLAPSASLGADNVGLYEPIHGSAPDIAGENKANPIGAILSAAMMFRYSLGDGKAADVVEQAVEQVLAHGMTTADVGGALGTDAVSEAVCDRIVGF